MKSAADGKTMSHQADGLCIACTDPGKTIDFPEGVKAVSIPGQSPYTFTKDNFREDVSEDDPRSREALALRGFDEGAHPEPEELRAHVVGHADPVEDRVADEEHAEALAHGLSDEDHDVHERDCAPYLGEALACYVDDAAEVALDGADDEADEHAGDGEGEPEEEPYAHSVDDEGVHVAAALVESEGMRPAGREREADVGEDGVLVVARGGRGLGLHVDARAAVPRPFGYGVVLEVRGPRGAVGREDLPADLLWALEVEDAPCLVDAEPGGLHVVERGDDGLAVLFEGCGVGDLLGADGAHDVRQHAEDEDAPERDEGVPGALDALEGAETFSCKRREVEHGVISLRSRFLGR